jgi:predicted nucleic acid-binding protein
MTTRIYFDSSVYVKHFKAEDGSHAVKHIIHLAEKHEQVKIFLSLWTINESIAGIDRNYYQKKLISTKDRNKIIATILDSSLKYLQTYPNIIFVRLNSNIVGDSISLIKSLHISADDALHVYTALKYRCKYFICHDKGLKQRVGNNIRGMTVLDIADMTEMRRLFDNISYSSRNANTRRRKQF